MTEQRQQEFRGIDNLSQLLDAVIRDGQEILVQIGQGEPYEPDSSRFHWHCGMCHVCAAGAVMAQSLGAKPAYDIGPYSFPADISTRLTAIDQLRRYDLVAAAMSLWGKIPPSVGSAVRSDAFMNLRNGPQSPTAFRGGSQFRTFLGGMEALRDWLRHHGL